jgi:hypothetical protein
VDVVVPPALVGSSGRLSAASGGPGLTVAKDRFVNGTPRPFEFRTRLTVTKLTRRTATTVADLLRHLREVPSSVVFHHTHHFLVQHQELSPEPPNDFAHWVTNTLQLDELGERLASVDTIRFASLNALQARLIEILDGYVAGGNGDRSAPAGEQFHFKDAVSVILPTGYVAKSVAEFRTALMRVSTGSIAYHLFEARLRVGAEDNDFSCWLEREVDLPAVARAIRALDPYTNTLEGLRQVLLGLVPER